jgi:hypothetical protein
VVQISIAGNNRSAGSYRIIKGQVGSQIGISWRIFLPLSKGRNDFDMHGKFRESTVVFSLMLSIKLYEVKEFHVFFITHYFPALL